MSEAIYIKKPEDIINLSPDIEIDIPKGKKGMNDTNKQNEDVGNSDGEDECSTAVNNKEDESGCVENLYVKEPGREDTLETGVRGDEKRDLEVYNPEDSVNDAPGFDYDNYTGTESIPLEPLALDESFEENSRRLVEVDDGGNTLKTHSRIPSKYSKASTPQQDSQTEHLLQALARLDLETISTESQGVQPVLDTDEDYLTPRTHEHIYAEIVDRKVERHVKPTGSVRVVENERRVRVPIIRRLTRTFSINRHHGHGHRNSSSTLYRDRLSKLPKTPVEKENVTCSCNKKILLCSVVVMLCVLLLGVIAAVLLTMVLNKDNQPVRSERLKDVIFPTVLCPDSQVVTLTKYKTKVKLHGAETKDNTGIKLLEYKAIIEDGSATFVEPDILVLSRLSVGNTYTVAVTTLDLDDNEAVCNYTVSVEEDLCVPWRIPVVEGAERSEVATPGGWEVTLQCPGQTAGDGAGRMPHILSYHYLDTPTLFTCSSGQTFLPQGSFSCQKADLARYKFITSMEYQFLDNDRNQLPNITVEKAKSCFQNYYAKTLLNVQQQKSVTLVEQIKASVASLKHVDLSTMELAPIPYHYPKITEFDQRNGKVRAIKVAIGYQIGPVNQPFPDDVLNVYVGGTLQSEHTVAFTPGNQPFHRLRGNVNAGCPDVLIPGGAALFVSISSGFMCTDGEKKHSVHDEYIDAEVTVCLGCPAGEYYSVSKSSCEICSIGTYQDTVGSMACTSCPTNTTTTNAGARDFDDCLPV